MRVSRAGAPVVAGLGLAAAAGGLWEYAGGTAEAPGMVQYAAVAGGAGLLGSLILWHRPDNRYGRTHLAIGLLFGSLVLATGVLSSGAALPFWAAQVALAWSWLSLTALLPLWVVVIAAFPDGRFHRRMLGRATVVLTVLMGLLTTLGYLLFPPGGTLPLIALPTTGLRGPLAGAGLDGSFEIVATAGAALGTAAPLLAVVALGDRYRTAGLVVRQQIKWLLVGATVSVLLQSVPVAAIESEVLRTAAGVLVVLAAPLPLLAAALAIFRYGLWEIDLVLSKGLVYAAVSGLLAFLFLSVAVAVGLGVGGADVRVATSVGLALLVSYLARPLRHRLEAMLTRAVYGVEPRGLLALSRQPSPGHRDVRDEGARIAEVARSALGAPWARVWLHLRADGPGVLHPLAASGTELGPPVVLPGPAVDILLGLRGAAVAQGVAPEAAGLLDALVTGGGDAVAPLLVDDELVGLVACGARPHQPLDGEDLDLLAVLARESALVLENLRLDDELRLRLDQIEQQAAELRRSRQRLMVAQDEERRRIERDLHDGAQQRLVSLAARLRRSAATAAEAQSAELTALADEAEEAVFTLQELARGIYPSVLADRGLHVALQAQAARLPAPVRVEVGPSLHGRRLSRELEAVLYYVALEAMTNALKHAPGSAISVLLHTDDRSGSVVLEVHDDGPGFDPRTRTGSGLQNMADRVAAVDGVLSVESAAGAGTWVRAEVRETATVTPISGAEATP